MEGKFNYMELPEKVFLKSLFQPFGTRMSRTAREKSGRFKGFSVKVCMIRVFRVQKEVKKQSLKSRKKTVHLYWRNE